MSVSNEFKNAVNKWVEIDNKQKKLKELMNSLKKDKEKYQEYMLDYMSDNNMKKKNIIINGGKLCYNETKNLQPLNKKYIIEQLSKYHKNTSRAEEITNYLYNREIKIKSVIKRFNK